MMYRHYEITTLRQWASIAILSLPSMVIAQERLGAGLPMPNASDIGWRVEYSSVVLGDGSHLNEYRALANDTFSGNAQLVVAFYPRFNCAPNATLQFPDGVVDNIPADDSLLNVVVGSEHVVWPVTMDSIDGVVMLSNASDSANQQALWELLDESSRASVLLDVEVKLQFSLLGSRASIADAHERCMTHQPQEWTPVINQVSADQDDWER